MKAMGDPEKELSPQENIMQRFSNIKNLCDSGISLLSKKEPGEIDTGDAVFEVTEKIQEEIEEIRDIIWG
jgi:hypothetical protein